MNIEVESYIDLKSESQCMYNDVTGAQAEGVEDTVYRVYYRVKSFQLGYDANGSPAYEHEKEILRCETKRIVGFDRDQDGIAIPVHDWQPDNLTIAMRDAAYDLIDQHLDDQDAQMQAEMFEEQE